MLVRVSIYWFTVYKDIQMHLGNQGFVEAYHLVLGSVVGFSTS
ncbi:hypothetical protein [Sporisorium scitamineum]|uniref:Uncharacterized protein n=1 Tax=Sporisorium scitamineum TaxID=49012 RepID=A0A0F7RRT9_9BASI|nr:hypothetical protein [Sporisorium scitamineum]